MKRTMIRTACITRWRCGYGWSHMHRRAMALRVKGNAFKDSYDEKTPISCNPKETPSGR